MKVFIIVLIVAILFVYFLLSPVQKKKIKALFSNNKNYTNKVQKKCSVADNTQKQQQERSKIEKCINQLDENVKKLEDEVLHIQNDLNEVHRVIDNAQDWYHFVNETNAALNKLKNEVAELELRKETLNVNSSHNTSTLQNNIVYVKNFDGTFLRVVGKDDAQYILKLKTASEADFEFYGSINVAIANRDAVFDGICQLTGNAQNATRILTIESGKAILENGKWKVVKKAIIKFE